VYSREYLTGFSKRKQERRRFGLDMEAFKQKKQLLEARKQRREEQKQLMAQLNIKDSDKEDEEENEEEEENSGDEETQTQVLTFDDAHTQSKFGDVVTVTTSVGDLKSDSEDNFSDFDDDEVADKANAAPRHGKNDKEQHLSLFQRIQLKRKGLALPSKRAKLKQARDSKKAMMGSGKKAGKKGNLGRVNGLARKDEKKSGGKGKGTESKMPKKMGGGKKRKH
jgi:ribosomal RNA-processing protein 17